MLSHRNLLTLLFSSVLLSVALTLAGCSKSRAKSEVETTKQKLQFRHHYVDKNPPLGKNSGSYSYGQTALVDLDHDGDLDFTVGHQSGVGGTIYWYEYQAAGKWAKHVLGEESPSDVGATTMDVDGDGWTDFVAGGAWYRNPAPPGEKPFERIVFDPELERVHDVVASDVDGDGHLDILTMSDKNNLRWYKIPADPTKPWKRQDVGPSVHAAIAPAGVGDLDGDGDADIMRTNAWFENLDGKGIEWTMHENVPFGINGGLWPNASRSYILDFDKDGDNDVVTSDNEYGGGKVAWIENLDGKGREWMRHDLPVNDEAKRGGYHALAVADFDKDGDLDVFSVEMEATTDFIKGEKDPRFFIWENLDGKAGEFTEHVILNTKLGGHEPVVGDVDGDGDIDIVSKIWNTYPENGNQGRGHIDYLENLLAD